MSKYFKGSYTTEKPLFGFAAPKRTKKECANPVFHDKCLHRIGIFPKHYNYRVTKKGQRSLDQDFIKE